MDKQRVIDRGIDFFYFFFLHDFGIRYPTTCRIRDCASVRRYGGLV